MNPAQLLAHFDRISEAPNAIPHLRRFILDLAVRGKLVEQDPNDEPAGELLRRIQVEREKLGKEGILRKKLLNFLRKEPEFQFELPSTWEMVYLGEIAQYGVPEKVNSNTEIPEDTWVLDLEDIEKDSSRLVNRVMSSDRPFQSTKTIFKNGDVLFGKLRPYLNKVLVADIDGVCTTEIIPIRSYFGIVPEYSKLVLKSPLTMQRVDRLMYGMKMPRLGTDDAISLSFPLPPLPEQNRIVAKVDELMALCDQLEAAKAERESQRDRLITASLHHLNSSTDADASREQTRFYLNHLPRLTTRPEHIKQLRQTILNLAVRGRLVPQDLNDEPARELLKKIRAEKERLIKYKENMSIEFKVSNMPFPIPRNWMWVYFGQIMISRDGERIPVSKEERNNREKIYDYYGASGIIDKIDDYLFDKPLLLIGEDGANLINRSTPIAFIARGQYWVNNHAHVLDGISEEFLRFIEMYINATDLRPYVTGTAQPKMNQAKMNSIPIALPPENEQHRIVAKVDELMALCDQLEAQLTTSQADSRRLLEALLHRALGEHI